MQRAPREGEGSRKVEQDFKRCFL